MPLKKSSKPLSSFISDFLDWLDIEKGLSNKTQENYRRFLQKFLFWLKENNLEQLKPHQLSPEHIWKYRVFLSRHSKKPLKKTTQCYYLIALRALLMFFAERNILSLPADKVTLPKIQKEKSVKFLTLEQIKKLLEAPDINKIQGLRDRAILEMLFSTGMRIAELVSLNRDQIKFEKETKDLELVIIGKGQKPRTVYISQRALEWLKKYLQTRQDKNKALFINYRSKKGSDRRLTSRYIEMMVKKYALQAGVPLFTTPHTLRHSFASDLLSKGVDLRIIQEFLGHSSITSTQIYTHVSSKKLRDIHRQFHKI